MLRESNAVSSEGIGESRGGLSVLGPTDHLHHGPCHPLTLQPLSSQQHARPGPLNGLHIQVLIEMRLPATPITGTPATKACWVVKLPPLQTTTAERAAAASPGR